MHYLIVTSKQQEPVQGKGKRGTANSRERNWRHLSELLLFVGLDVCTVCAESCDSETEQPITSQLELHSSTLLNIRIHDMNQFPRFLYCVNGNKRTIKTAQLRNNMRLQQDRILITWHLHPNMYKQSIIS